MYSKSSLCTDTEHYEIDKVLLENGLIPYRPEHLELISPIENSSIKIFLLEQGYSYLLQSPPKLAILSKLLVTVVQSSVGSQEWVHSLNSCSSYWIYAGLDGNAVEAVASVLLL